MWMTLMRLNRKAEAAKVLERITPKMDILENTAYHRRLLMYKGLEKPEALLDTATPTDADCDAGLRRRQLLLRHRQHRESTRGPPDDCRLAASRRQTELSTSPASPASSEDRSTCGTYSRSRPMS